MIKKFNLKKLIKLLSRRSMFKSAVSLFLALVSVTVVTFAWFAIRNSEIKGNDLNLLDKVSGYGVEFLIDGSVQDPGTFEMLLEEAAPGKVYTVMLQITNSNAESDPSEKLHILLGSCEGRMYDFDNEDLYEEIDDTEDGVLSFFYITGIYITHEETTMFKPTKDGLGNPLLDEEGNPIKYPEVIMTEVFTDEDGFKLDCRSIGNSQNDLLVGVCEPPLPGEIKTVAFFIFVSNIDPSRMINNIDVAHDELRPFADWLAPSVDPLNIKDVNRFQGSQIHIARISMMLGTD